MPDHLLLPEPHPLPSRRAGGGGGGGVARDRPAHGRKLREELSEVTRAPRRIDQGVDPDRVFKMLATSRPADSAFAGRDLEMLGETAEYTYFVLATDDGESLSEALDAYAARGDLSSFFDAVDEIRPYGPEDRRGPGLELAVEPGDRVVIDIAIWAAPNIREAQARAGTVERVIARRDGQVLLRSLGARRNYLRAEVDGACLDDLLETSVVELIRTPPVPFLDFRDWWTLGAEDVDLDRQPGLTVGILDDAPAVAHPFLDGLVLSVEDTAPAGYQWQRQGGHGTEVVGRVVYPNLDQQLRDGARLVAVGNVRVARVLEPDPHSPASAPRFATFGLPHDLVAAAITHLHKKYGIRVFNLSLGYKEPFTGVHVGPMTEVIDDLVRELDIVVVVPTGNVPIPPDGRTPSGHHVIADKPAYLSTPEHRLAEPGPAALAVTVGSIALSGAAAELRANTGAQAVAVAGEISPFSRVGPGVGVRTGRHNKPDVVHHGGNTVVTDTGQAKANDLGAGIVTTSGTPHQRLLTSVSGTSIAVPGVARVAADVLDAYPDASANLIRALLAVGAQPPVPALAVMEPDKRAARYGLGVPATSRCIDSGSTRVTMTYDGDLPVDTVQIHPLPVPEAFRRGSGERTVSVYLAFDPPVRHQRREYLAASMKVDLYRDIDRRELEEILVKQDPDDKQEMIKGHRRPRLVPGSDSFLSATLQRRVWTARRSFIDDDETFYVAVTHTAQTWARDDPAYTRQRYALAVTLERRGLVSVDLRQELLTRVRIPARLRVRV